MKRRSRALPTTGEPGARVEAGPPGPRRGGPWPWLAATALPAAVIGVVVALHAVDTPFWDDWRKVSETLVKAREGSLGLSGLYALHNEGRPFFPRLWYLATGLVTDGRCPAVLAGTVALAVLSSLLLFLLLRRTTGLSPSQLAVASFAGNLLVFSPRQSENWLWAASLDYFVPVCCLTGSLLLLGREGRGRLRTLGAGLLCVVATYSYPNGMLLWLLVAPFVAASARPAAAAGWLAAASLSVGLYFRGFGGPSGLGGALAHPVDTGAYVLAFLGNQAGNGKLSLSLAIGGALVAALGVAAAFAVAGVLRGRHRPALLAWLAVAGYPLLSAGAAAAGRSHLGIAQALSNRYVTFSLYLPIGIGGLVLALRSPAGAPGRPWRAGRPLAALLLGAFLVLQAFGWVEGIQGIAWVGRMLRYGKSCLHFLQTAPNHACLDAWVHDDRAVLAGVAAKLDGIHALRPPLARGSERGLEDHAPPGPEGAVGVFEGLSVVDGKLTALGWGALPGGRRADAILLASRTAGGAWVPIGFEPPMGPRPDVERERGAAWASSGWVHSLEKDPAPAPGTVLSAWAFDADRGEAYRLRGEFVVPPSR